MLSGSQVDRTSIIKKKPNKQNRHVQFYTFKTSKQRGCFVYKEGKDLPEINK